MPYKHKQHLKHHWNKQRYGISNWSDYNNALKKRGSITLWISQEVIDNWYTRDVKNDGTGMPATYTDAAIIVAHELRLLLKLPLRQMEGLINSIFKIYDVEVRCPEYSTLSKRLGKLDISVPRYRGPTEEPPKSRILNLSIV